MSGPARCLAYVGAFLAAAVYSASPAGAAPGDLVLASSSSEGVKGDAPSLLASLSADGTLVAFQSDAKLAPQDTDQLTDIYLKDLSSGEVTLVSTSATGAKGNGASTDPELSATGTRVAFVSKARNLHPADEDYDADIFVKELATGAVMLASVSSSGEKANRLNQEPVISDDGQRVAFKSGATNLDPGDTDTVFDAYLKDLSTGEMTLISTSSQGLKPAAGIETEGVISISGDGSRVAFVSKAADLHPQDPDTTADVFIKDVATGTLILGSRNAAGQKGNRSSRHPDLSPTGTVVSFNSQATNLDRGDIDTRWDVYVKDLVSGDIVLASTDSIGRKGANQSFAADMSADGAKVVIHTDAQFDPRDSSDDGDIYVKNLITGSMTLASVSPTGQSSNAPSRLPSISADGSVVAFHSLADNLLPEDPDTIADVYVAEPLNEPPPSADLSVSVSVASASKVGDQVEYTVIVANAGPDQSAGTTLEVAIDADMVFHSVVPPRGTCVHWGGSLGGLVVCDLGFLKAGTSLSVKVVAAPITLGPRKSSAFVYGSIEDPVLTNNVAARRTLAAGPSCSIVGTPGPDVVRGTSEDDVVCGLGGDDALTGGPGDADGSDVLLGGSGADLLDAVDGLSANDLLDGGAGVDACVGDAGDSVTRCEG
jgi:uncharacterized repeat protein (TIGR01451 family)